MKERPIITIFFFILLATAIAVSAVQPMQTTQKILLSPFYLPSLSANTNTTFTVNVQSPSELTSVDSAIITYDLWINPAVNFNLWVNGKTCNNPTYAISTTFAGAGHAQAIFDCTNIIKTTGTYTVTLRSDKNTGSATGWLDVTTTNNPSGSVALHGTEYTYPAHAKLWLQLVNSNNTNIDNGVCYIDIYTPDNEEYIERATMENFNHDGIYYYDLETPSQSGVYPAIATCYYTATQNKRVATSYNITSGVLKSGTINDTQTLDGTKLVITTSKNGGLTTNNRVNVTLNFSDFNAQCGNVSPLLYTGTTWHWTGIWNTNTANHNILIYTYNYSNNSWLQLPNVIGSGAGTATFTVSNSIAMTNISSLGINATNQMLLRFTDTDINEGAKDFRTDYAYVSCDQLGTPQYQILRGSSEMHINSPVENFITSIDTVRVTNNVSYNGENASYYTGIFSENFSVQSTVTHNTNDVLVIHSPFHTLPCNSILNLYRWENNGSLTKIGFTTNTHTFQKECSIQFYENLTVGENKQYLVTARNSWESDLRSTNSGVQSIYPLISAGCDYWAITRNETPYPYVVPRAQGYDNTSAFYRSCSNFYDDFYWFNNTYHTSNETKYNITDEASFVNYESWYESTKFAEEKLDTITYLLVNNLLSTGIYSELILVDVLNRSDLNGNKFWANFSTTHLNFNIIGAQQATIANLNDTITKFRDASYGNYSLFNNDFTVLQNKIDNLTNNNAVIIGNITLLQNNISILYGAVTTLNGTMVGSANNISTIINNVANLQNTANSILSVSNTIDGTTVSIQNAVNSQTTTINGIALNTSNITNNINNINNNLTGISQSLNGVNGNLTAIYNAVLAINITVPPSYNHTELENSLANITFQISVVQTTLNGINTNISAQNLSAINESLTGLIISESNKPVEFDASIVFLLIYVLLMLLAVKIRENWFLAMTGIYGIIFGVFMVATVSFWFGGILLGIGLLFMWRGFSNSR